MDGLSTMTGGAGNDIFNANTDTTGTAAETFTSLDTIDGGAGNDTLNINSTVSANFVANAAGVSVSNIETANVTAAGAIAINTTGWTGLETLNLKSVAATVATADTTTDVNELTSVAASTISGGKNVTVVHTDATVASNVIVNSTDAAEGSINITSSMTALATTAGTVTVGNDASAATILATAATGAVTIAAEGDIKVVGATTIDASITNAVSLADRTAHTAAAAAANLVANNTGATGTAKTADTAAAAKVTALTTLAGNYAAADVDSDTIAETNALTLTELKAGNITAAEKASIDAAYATAYCANTGNAAAKAAAGQAAALAVINPILATATAAKATTAAALVTAVAATVAAEAVVTADAAAELLVEAADLDAVANTLLTSVTVSGNYGNVGTELNTITDGSGNKDKLTTVTLNNAGDATITSNVLATLNVTDAVNETNIAVVNATADNTLALNLNTSSIDFINAGDTIKTLNVVSTGTNTLDIDATNVSVLKISGAGNTTIVDTSSAAALVTDASSATGNVTMTVASTETYTGGSGVDTITAGAVAQAKAIDGGAGSADVLVITNATALTAAAPGAAVTGAALFTNFEVLNVGGAAVNVDVSKIAGITSLIASGADTTFTAASIAQASNLTVMANGNDQKLTLDVTGSATGVQTISMTTVGNVDFQGDLTIANVEKINLNTTIATGATTALVEIDDLLTVASLTNLVATGAGALTLATGDFTAASNVEFDASGVTAAVTIDASLGKGTGWTITGSATHANTLKSINNGVAGTTTITGGAAVDTITGGAFNDIINSGEGNDIIVTGNGVNAVTTGNGHSTITGGTGVDTVTVGNGYNTIATQGGKDVITVGTGGNMINAGTAADTITLGAHAAGVVNTITQGVADSIVVSAKTTTDGAAIAAGDVFTFNTTTVANVDVITGFDASCGDVINTATVGTAATIIGKTESNLGTGIVFASGTWNATTGTFTVTADGVGADTMIVDTANTGGADIMLNEGIFILKGVNSADLTSMTFGGRPSLGTLSMADATAAVALDAGAVYNLSDTAAALVAGAILNGAVNVAAADAATVAQAEVIADATNTGTTTYSVVDTYTLVESSADDVVATTKNGLAGATTISITDAGLTGTEAVTFNNLTGIAATTIDFTDSAATLTQTLLKTIGITDALTISDADVFTVTGVTIAGNDFEEAATIDLLNTGDTIDTTNGTLLAVNYVSVFTTQGILATATDAISITADGTGAGGTIAATAAIDTFFMVAGDASNFDSITGLTTADKLDFQAADISADGNVKTTAEVNAGAVNGVTKWHWDDATDTLTYYNAGATSAKAVELVGVSTVTVDANGLLSITGLDA